MPYIEKKDRIEDIDISEFVIESDDSGLIITDRFTIGKMMGVAMRNGGDLQYMLAVAIQVYIEKNGLRYQNCQDIMGALTGANAEFIRCIVSPYEEQKIADNGPVYNLAALTSKGY